jgi:hypothetical protein
MPDAPVGLVKQHVGQGGMGRLAFREAGGLVDRRAHQRMAESHTSLVHLD